MVQIMNPASMMRSVHQLRLSQDHPPRLILLHPPLDEVRSIPDEFLVISVVRDEHRLVSHDLVHAFHIYLDP